MLGLVRDSLHTPREAALRLIGLGLPVHVALQALGLVAAVSGLLIGVLSGGRLEIVTPDGALVLSPIGYAVTLFVTLTLGGLALASAGRALGGRGTAAGALAVVAWLQVVDLVVQAAVLLVAALVPPLAGPAALAALGVLLWCLLGFVQSLHGVGPGRALGIMLLAAFGLGVALAIVVGALGLGVPADA